MSVSTKAASASRNSAGMEVDGLPTRQRRLAIAAVLTAIVLIVLDGTIANLALPTIAQSLGVSPAAAIWVVTGYQLALVMFLLPAGAAGESLGYRRVFAGGVLLFTAASVLCAVSPSLPWLIAARFLQGFGSAAVMSVGVALVRFACPRHLVGTALGWNALAVALSSAAGPSLGAAILAVAGWRWLFAVNLPVGALVLLILYAMPAIPGSKRRLDLVATLLNAGVFGALVIGADLVALRPVPGAALLAVAAIGLVALIRRELPRQAPLIPFDLLRERPFRISVIASICCFSGQMAGYVALPFYLQHGLGQDAFTTGLYMTAWPLAVALAAPLSGRLADRISTAWPCAGGGIGLGAGLLLAALWPLRESMLPLVAFMAMCGLGFGFFQTPNNRNMLLSAPRQRSGAAGAIQGTARLTGQTAGALLMSVLFSLAPADLAPRLGLGIAAFLALAAGLVSTLRVGAPAQQAIDGSRPALAERA